MTSIEPEDIFKMQQLLYDKEDQKKILNSIISMGGVGGIGSFSLEFLIRNGFVNLRIADNDIYEKHNVRQLFMTSKSVGKKKVLIAKKRLKEICTNAKIQAFPEGITQSNYYKFCQDASVICAQTDQITSQVLLYMGAYKHKTKLLHAGRAKWPDKHLVTITKYDFSNSSGEFNLDSLNINPKQWGVDNVTLLYEFVDKTKKKIIDNLLCDEINRQNREYRKQSFVKSLQSKEAFHLTDKNISYLMKIVEENPEDFYKMAISPELCAISGSLIATAVKDIVLEKPFKRLAIDLYHGKLLENYED